MNPKTLAVLLTLAAVPAFAGQSLTARLALEAGLAADPAALEARAAIAPKLAPLVSPAIAARVGVLAEGILLTQLPPPPGGERPRGDLPPPPGGKLPPPPGGNLPPPPGFDPLPLPIYPGGPLPRGDRRLEEAERSYDQDGEYVGYWNGSRGYDEAHGIVNATPRDRSNEYILVLKSEEVQKRVNFVRKSDGLVYWYPTSNYIRTETRRLVVIFVNRAQKPLLPWEHEEFRFTFKGDRSRDGGVVLESASGAYRYEHSFRSDPRDPLTLVVEMEAKTKLLTPPDRGGVTLSLQTDGQGGLKLVATDLHGSFYAGESLQLAVTVKRDSGSIWRRDPVVLEVEERSPRTLTVPPGAADGATMVLPVSVPGPGQYYISGWSFQRHNSAISRGGWIRKGPGERVSP